MKVVDWICKKRDGLPLEKVEIEHFIEGVTREAIPDYQIAAWLMAAYLQGMNPQETADLTRAMAHSGETLDLSALPGFKVDKHSTGGVGDKTSLVITPLVAASGCIVPKMSGRCLGYSGGTLDKLESIPGFRVQMTRDEILAGLRLNGCVMVGQTKEIAPADKILYELRDVTGTVENIPLITASILSKKLAEGIQGLVLDVKCGRGAFVEDRASAAELAGLLVDIGNRSGVKTTALISDMNSPLGLAIGNALEVREALETLQGQGPPDLRDLSLALASAMVYLANPQEGRDQAEAQVRKALTTGAGLNKFRDLVEFQGGDPRVVDHPDRLPTAREIAFLHAPHAGHIHKADALLLAKAAKLLGAGRTRKEEAIDPTVGLKLAAKPGQAVHKGDLLAEIHFQHPERVAEARELAEQAFLIAESRPKVGPLVLETVI